jgi:hypothetical protein
MHDPNLSEFEIRKLDYEEDLFSVKDMDLELTPLEIRQIIETRRAMEYRIGTNGSIKLTMKISDSVQKLMRVLDEYQDEKVSRLAEDEEEFEEEDELEDAVSED